MQITPETLKAIGFNKSEEPGFSVNEDTTWYCNKFICVCFSNKEWRVAGTPISTIEQLMGYLTFRGQSPVRISKARLESLGFVKSGSVYAYKDDIDIRWENNWWRLYRKGQPQRSVTKMKQVIGYLNYIGYDL